MAAKSDYVSGTITLTNGDAAFTGTATGWLLAGFKEGDTIIDITGATEFMGVVATIDANGSGTLTKVWEGPTLTNVAYRMRYQPDGARVSAQARNLIELLGNGNVLALAGLSGSASQVPMFTGPGAMTLVPKTDLVSGVAYDVLVDLLADRAAYDGQAEGFSVLVADVGDGRSAFYAKVSASSGDWSAPAYVTGPVGPLPDVTVGTVTTGAPGSSVIVTPTPTLGGVELDFTIPAGRGQVPRGDYNPATAYVLDDAVLDNGSTWILTVPTSTGNAPPVLPTTSNAWWQLQARKGTDGAGTVSSVLAGDGISVDNTDPTAPVISAVIPGIPAQCRLTLTSGTPIMAADVASANTVYLTPYGGNFIPMYDGAAFASVGFAEISQVTTDTTKSPAAAAANSNYDMFVWDDGGTLRCTRGPAWTTSRGTGAGTSELEWIGGVPLNAEAITNGPAANRGTWVGTIHTNGSSLVDWIFGAIADGGSPAVFGVWNYWNRAPVITSVHMGDHSWGYIVAETWRAANLATGMRVSFVRGLDVDPVEGEYQTVFAPATGSNARVSVGLDSTSAIIPANCTTGLFNVQGVIGQIIGKYAGNPGAGFHYLQALEWVGVVAGGTFYGDANDPNNLQGTVLTAKLWQ